VRYVFSDGKLLDLALTHRSWVEEHGGSHNERLEWLGDSVLQLCVSELLFLRFPDKSEGDLSMLRRRLVNNDFLSGLADEIGLPERIHLGPEQRRRGEQHGRRVLAGAYEAVLGAVYVDGGLAQAAEWVRHDFTPHIEAAVQMTTLKHVKQVLQEWVHAQFGVHPEYRTVAGTGPDHDVAFEIEVLVNDEVVGSGEGPSKRIASAAAAQAALDRYGVAGEE
jgi:ribonuclease-3